jgi:hypothetical protein
MRPAHGWRKDVEATVHFWNRKPWIDIKCFRVKDSHGGAPRCQGETSASDNGAETNCIPKAAKGGNALHAAASMMSDQTDGRRDLYSKFIPE